MRIETENKKTFLSCVSFRKFRNVQTQSDILKFFIFANKRGLLELLSYGEGNHLFISVICFLKTTNSLIKA